MGIYTNYIDNINGKSVLTFEIDENKLYLGVPECYYIWVNSQNGAYVIYHDEIYLECDIEDRLYDRFVNDGYTNDDDFVSWVRDMIDSYPDIIYDTIDYEVSPCGTIIDEYYTGTWGKAVLDY